MVSIFFVVVCGVVGLDFLLVAVVGGTFVVGTRGLSAAASSSLPASLSSISCSRLA